jgi:murein tripeptide amidase MpaA
MITRSRVASRKALALALLCCISVSSLFAQTRGEEVIGRSVEGREITVRRIGNGEQAVLIVGGIHGGYEANSIVLSRRILEHFQQNPDELGSSFTLHVVDNMNPDGLHRITGGTPIEDFNFRAVNTVPGRFNARFVDLNRNWDADWEPTSFWGRREVDAGSSPFSEPETRAIRDYFERIDPVVSIFYQSAAAGLWYSGAEDQWPPSREVAEAYHRGSGYRLPATGDDDRPNLVDYEITGSADDYFYKVGHRNITVELTTHYDIEWERNLAGLRAVLEVLTAE